MLGTGKWASLKDSQDPELQNLATDLPATVLKSRVPYTIRKYMGAFRRWKVWATEHWLLVFSTKPLHVALYLQHLGSAKSSKTSAEEAINGLM